MLAQEQSGTDPVFLPSQAPNADSAWPPGATPLDCVSVCNAPGGGGQGGDAQEAAAGVMESWVLGSHCVTTKIWFWAF